MYECGTCARESAGKAVPARVMGAVLRRGNMPTRFRCHQNSGAQLDCKLCEFAPSAAIFLVYWHHPGSIQWPLQYSQFRTTSEAHISRATFGRLCWYVLLIEALYPPARKSLYTFGNRNNYLQGCNSRYVKVVLSHRWYYSTRACTIVHVHGMILRGALLAFPHRALQYCGFSTSGNKASAHWLWKQGCLRNVGRGMRSLMHRYNEKLGAWLNAHSKYLIPGELHLSIRACESN